MHKKGRFVQKKKMKIIYILVLCNSLNLNIKINPIFKIPFLAVVTNKSSVCQQVLFLAGVCTASHWSSLSLSSNQANSL